MVAYWVSKLKERSILPPKSQEELSKMILRDSKCGWFKKYQENNTKRDRHETMNVPSVPLKKRAEIERKIIAYKYKL